MSCTTFHGKDKRFETLLIDDWHTLADMYVIARGVPGGDAGDGGAKAQVVEVCESSRPTLTSRVNFWIMMSA